MTISILEALAKQKEINPYIHRERLIMEDGLLEISDAVFEIRMRELGFDKKDRNEWLSEPVAKRGIYMDQWDRGIK